jgi:uroporphyrinogen decarboxylase
MSKRERLEATLSGVRPDRPPVALWRHFPVDDQTPDGLAAATLEFQYQYDFDLVKVTPASSFCLRDWGIQDEWRGTTEGTRDYTVHVIHSEEDWMKLRHLDPHTGALGDQLVALRMIVGELQHDARPAPVIQTIFNPLSQAKNLVGKDALVWHLRRYPAAVHAALQVIVESTRRFIEAAKKTGIAGIFYAVQHGSYALLSDAEYEMFGRPYDLQVLESLDGLWLNMLHLHGEEIMFEKFLEYPLQIINWHDRDTYPSLSEARQLYTGTVCGGLQRENTMVLGSPLSVTAEAHDAINSAGPSRFILGTGCVLPTIAPRANIMAARQAVDGL